MNRIDETFLRLKKNNKKALIVFITAGFPDLRTSGKIIDTLVDSGVDAIEIGVPFSDPIADGPTIQFASQRALHNGITLPVIIRWVKKLRSRIHIPLLLMGYVNPFYQYGFEKFIRNTRGLIDGLIIPDLSLEESGTYIPLFRRSGMRLIQLITPVSSMLRMKKIITAGDGFLYAVSVAGVTGARTTIPKSTVVFLRTLRSLTARPIAVGIGISHPRQIAMVKHMVDGIIVGSAYIKLMQKYRGKKLLNEIKHYTRTLKGALG